MRQSNYVHPGTDTLYILNQPLEAATGATVPLSLCYEHFKQDKKKGSSNHVCTDTSIITTLLEFQNLNYLWRLRQVPQTK